MHPYLASIEWRRKGGEFQRGRWASTFDGDSRVSASASPHVGPHPLSSEQAIDLEEAPVAAAASCHMPSFPYGAARRGSTVDRYADAAESLMETIARWHDAITRIVLRPRIDCAGNARPDAVKVGGLHHAAREERYLDNEVLARIVVEDSAVPA